MTKLGTSYATDALIGVEADIKPNPDHQAAALAYLHAHGHADLAECLGLSA